MNLYHMQKASHKKFMLKANHLCRLEMKTDLMMDPGEYHKRQERDLMRHHLPMCIQGFFKVF